MLSLWSIGGHGFRDHAHQSLEPHVFVLKPCRAVTHFRESIPRAVLVFKSTYMALLSGHIHIHVVSPQSSMLGIVLTTCLRRIFYYLNSLRTVRYIYLSVDAMVGVGAGTLPSIL